MMKKKTNAIKLSASDRRFYIFNAVFMTMVFLLYAWPLWFVFISSFSDPDLVQSGGVILFPRG